MTDLMGNMSDAAQSTPWTDILWYLAMAATLAVLLTLAGLGGLYISSRRDTARRARAIAGKAAARRDSAPRVFVSFTRDDLAKAEALDAELTKSRLTVDRMDADRLWSDPMYEVIDAIEHAAVVVLLEPAGGRAAWVSAEARLAELFGAALVSIPNTDDPLARCAEIAAVAGSVDWDKRLSSAYHSGAMNEVLKIFTDHSQTPDGDENPRVTRAIDRDYVYGSETGAYLSHRAGEMGPDHTPMILGLLLTVLAYRIGSVAALLWGLYGLVWILS